MPSEMRSAYRGMVALVAASQEGIRGRVRTQKLAFLAVEIGASDFSELKFSYEPSGPYSRQISDCLQSLVGIGLIEETFDENEEWNSVYRYSLTGDGEAWIEENKPKDFELLKQIVSEFGDASVSALELASKVRFFHRKGENVDEEYALKKAVEGTPNSKTFQKEARILLQKFEKKYDTLGNNSSS